MGQGYYDTVVKELKKLGYYQASSSKHQKWRHDDGLPSVIVPHNIVSKHTANAILKAAGAKKKV